MPDFKLTRYQIQVPDKKRGPSKDFTAVLLSDLHNVSYGEGNRDLLEAILSVNPEVVFASGDMLTAKSGAETDAALALMEGLAKNFPVFYANGNHESRLKERSEDRTGDYGKYAESIKGFGVHLLENTSKEITIHGMPIDVRGLELPMDYYRHFKRLDLTLGEMDEMLGKANDKAYQLLLAHCPLYFETYAVWGADLTLSGHLHGGMVRIPGIGGVISTQFRLFPKYDKGLFNLDTGKMVVSAGLGDHTIKLRVNNPHELVVLNFQQNGK